MRTAGVKVLAAEELGAYAGSDRCAGTVRWKCNRPSGTDTKVCGLYNVVDSFDTHARIPEHFAAVDAAAKKAGKVGIISCGWDPGMFSLNRLYANAILPEGSDYTFWGRGVSQGHSDAIRRIAGVKTQDSTPFRFQRQ